MCDVLDRVENRGKALGAEAKAKETAINTFSRERIKDCGETLEGIMK